MVLKGTAEQLQDRVGLLKSFDDIDRNTTEVA